jgi:hypothetical protein
MVLLKLFSQTQFLDQSAVTLQVMLLHVTEQALTLAYQLHQTALSRMVFVVFL